MKPQNIGSGIAYDYGIDAEGKMYIWDKHARKMTFYGDPAKGISQVQSLVVGHGAKVNFQGDKTGGEWKNPQPNVQKTGAQQAAIGGGGSFAPAAKALDQAALDSIDAQLRGYETDRANAKTKATLKRDTSVKEKEEERAREQAKYDGSKLSVLQDFGGALQDTSLNTRNTIENLVSSLSTLGLGGGRALQRQILDAANMSNRKANATQASDNRNLDTSFNEYIAGNENDLRKIQDQFGYDTGEADRKFYQDRQNALYKKADIYNAADRASERENLMREGNSLTSLIGGSAFLNPSYTGESRQMATADLGDYNQDIARYDTTAIGSEGAPAQGGAGNLAVRAIAVNDKDLGIKKKSEGDLGYGV